ncbi:ATP/GTP-binding protein [Streptomyces mordarskii]|uniref:ATP/GTP-binding protein n=2 Tax=Streptomyces mordarskii TaxID=1226758 RepID=A0ABP3PSM6_9ACTN
MDDPQRVASEARLLVRRTAFTAAGFALVMALADVAYADDHSGGQASVSDCSTVFVCVGASEPGASGSKGSQNQPAQDRKGGKAGKPAPQPCKVVRLDPQPPAGSEIWDGHKPGDGAIYTRRCLLDAGAAALTVGVMPSQTFWAATPPAATGPDPAQLAREAVDKMLLKGPDINSPKPAPPNGCGKSAKPPAGFGCYTVGVPLWMSMGTSDTTWGPNTATATAGGTTVTATAKVGKVVWTMGDGSTVTCTTPGTPYKASYGTKKSPDCGHQYTQTSKNKKDGTFAVSATSTWDIDWNGGGQQGQLVETRTSQVQVDISELQVVS